MQVYNRGVISISTTLQSITANSFPLPANRNDAVIAPFWEDIITGTTGDVWYHQSTNSTLLNRASIEIRNAFSTQESADFTATLLFIATWDRVIAAGRSDLVSTYYYNIIMQ